MRKLENVLVTHVSYVDKAANKQKFFLTKASEVLEPTFETEVKLVTKADDPQQLVYGVVYAPDVEDVHGDFMDAETIEKAAHKFIEDYQQIDKQHDFTTNAGKVVESYIAPVDMKIEDTEIAKGTWVLVTKATDEIWEAIQKNEFTGYSLAGTAQVEDVKKQTTDNFNRRKFYRDINAALDAFHSAAWSILDNYTDADADKVASIQSEIDELSLLISSIDTTKSITKQGLIETIKSFFNTKKTEENAEMTTEELTKALSEALQPINKRLENLEKDAKGENTPPETTPKATVESDEDSLAKAVSEALAPINTKIEQLEKARISNNTEQNYTETIEKSDIPSYVDAAFPISE